MYLFESQVVVDLQDSKINLIPSLLNVHTNLDHSNITPKQSFI